MRHLFFCKISGEMLLHQAGGAHRALRKRLLMGAQLNTQGFLPVAFVLVTFYNKGKDGSFSFFDIDGYSKYKEQNMYTSSRCEY